METAPPDAPVPLPPRIGPSVILRRPGLPAAAAFWLALFVGAGAAGAQPPSRPPPTEVEKPPPAEGEEAPPTERRAEEKQEEGEVPGEARAGTGEGVGASAQEGAADEATGEEAGGESQEQEAGGGNPEESGGGDQVETAEGDGEAPETEEEGGADRTGGRRPGRGVAGPGPSGFLPAEPVLETPPAPGRAVIGLVLLPGRFVMLDDAGRITAYGTDDLQARWATSGPEDAAFLGLVADRLAVLGRSGRVEFFDPESGDRLETLSTGLRVEEGPRPAHAPAAALNGALIAAGSGSFGLFEVRNEIESFFAPLPEDSVATALATLAPPKREPDFDAGDEDADGEDGRERPEMDDEGDGRGEGVGDDRDGQGEGVGNDGGAAPSEPAGADGNGADPAATVAGKADVPSPEAGPTNLPTAWKEMPDGPGGEAGTTEIALAESGEKDNPTANAGMADVPETEASTTEVPAIAGGAGNDATAEAGTKERPTTDVSRDPLFPTGSADLIPGDPIAEAPLPPLFALSLGAGGVAVMDGGVREVRWHGADTGPVVGPAAMSEELDLVAVGDAEGTLHAFRLSDGTRRWRWVLREGLHDPPLVVGRSLYVATWGNTLYRFHMHGGEQWRSALPGRPAAPPILAGRKILVVTMDGRMLEFDPRTGERESQPQDLDADVSGVVDYVAGGRWPERRLYLGIRDGSLRVLAPEGAVHPEDGADDEPTDEENPEDEKEPGGRPNEPRAQGTPGDTGADRA